MKSLVRILVVTTLLLAFSTIYLAWALRLEKMRNTESVSVATTRPAMPPLIASVPAAAATGGPSPATEAAARTDAEKAAAARSQLLRYRDPAKRAEMVARSRAFASKLWQSIAPVISLSASELDGLLNILSEQGVRFDESRLECQIESGCDLQALNASLRESARTNLANLLGPARFEKYRAYQDAVPEQTYLRDLNTHLPVESRLTDAQQVQLALELAEERHKFVEEAERPDRKIHVSTASFLVEELHGDSPPEPMRAPSNKELSSQYNDKLRGRAARSLNQEQLAAFRKMQDERVANGRFVEALTAH